MITMKMPIPYFCKEIIYTFSLKVKPGCDVSNPFLLLENKKNSKTFHT